MVYWRFKSLIQTFFYMWYPCCSNLTYSYQILANYNLEGKASWECVKKCVGKRLLIYVIGVHKIKEILNDSFIPEWLQMTGHHSPRHYAPPGLQQEC